MDQSIETQLEKFGPLHGYRVLDFGWVLAGAIPGMVLADMGAEVIKVETRQRLDYMRQGPPHHRRPARPRTAPDVPQRQPQQA